MTAKILSGKQIAEAIKSEVAAAVEKLNYQPGLTVVRVGEDSASAVYVGSKVKTAAELGIKSVEHHLDANISENELLSLIDKLNGDETVDGILVQLPLPKQINEREILERIAPEKDVDGFHPISVGKLSQGRKSLAPCTPAGVIEILKRFDIPIKGKHAVVVGRSNIVGKPMAQLLLHEDATVTICHSRTENLANITSQADILVAAVGRVNFIRGEHIKEGATVIDVGINSFSDQAAAHEMFDESELEKRLNVIEKRGATLVGDVNPKEARQKAANFTPVPGGVGLLTIAMLMKNTVEAAEMRRNGKWKVENGK